MRDSAVLWDEVFRAAMGKMEKFSGAVTLKSDFFCCLYANELGKKKSAVRAYKAAATTGTPQNHRLTNVNLTPLVNEQKILLFTYVVHFIHFFVLSETRTLNDQIEAVTVKCSLNTVSIISMAATNVETEQGRRISLKTKFSVSLNNVCPFVLRLTHYS